MSSLLCHAHQMIRIPCWNSCLRGGVRGMASVITTGWHLWVIKGGGSASKELTLPALTFTKVEIKAPLQTIYGNSNVQSATVFVRCLALTHARAYTYTPSGTLTRGLCVQQMTSKCCNLQRRSCRRTCPNLNKRCFTLLVLKFISGNKKSVK